MLSRRQLRMKVLQALYGFFKSDNDRMDLGEKQLFVGINKLYELCFWQLAMILEVIDFAAVRIEENKRKHFPTEEDLNPNTKLIENSFIKMLRENRDFQRKVEAYKIFWGEESEMIRKIYMKIKDSNDYDLYMNSGNNSFDEDKEYIIKMFKKQIAKIDSLRHYYEDQSIYWTDDYHAVSSLVVKIINSFSENSDEFHVIPTIIKDEKEKLCEDKDFVKQLFRKTILNSDKYEKLITEKTVNWEFERIASMDILILKMALAELFEFTSIPVKVTLNEYIELAKYYSTPKSSVFVNGILDKLIAELTESKEIKKSGRGLMQ
ncbi:MAG: transcription antitermination factor NusB [Bacteroidetes bacterium]|nr:transcription antitermination factor NusB [Bacteroidota bacterium]